MKISILFKPSQRSGITSALTESGFFNIDYKNLYSGDFTRRSKVKCIIHDIPADDLGEVYKDVKTMFRDDSVVILCSNISNLEF